MASVIALIVSTNEASWLCSCLDSLEKSSVPIPVILVDNGSTDNTRDHGNAHANVLRTVEVRQRLGFAAANNLALTTLDLSQFDYVLLLNPDTVVHPNAVERLVSFMEQSPSYGVSGAYQIQYGDSTWSKPNAWTKAVLNEALEMGGTPVDFREFVVLDHYYVQGAAMLIRSDCLDRVGMLDPVYGTFYEETDLCRRILWSGMRVGLVFDAMVQHVGGAGWRKSWFSRMKRDWLMIRNQLIYELSDVDDTQTGLKRVAKIVHQQIRAIQHRKNDYIFPVYLYPAPALSVVLYHREIALMRRRRQLIKQGAELPQLLRAIGEIEHTNDNH